jgi:hypothetical protein
MVFTREVVEEVKTVGRSVVGVLEGECKTKSGVQAEWVTP